MSIQNTTPDSLFTAEQQKRLATLMKEWRIARDQNTELPPEQQTELDALIEAELVAAIERTKALIQKSTE